MTTRAKTVTILFTDLVGSTELLQRAGDEQAQRVLKAHHRLLSGAVQQHGGHEVKWLGDGLMVAFDSAQDAVKCAIAMQQSSRRPTAGERLEIRAGLHVGEAFVDEAATAVDYFGTSVVIARRLCDTGSAGQILASEIVVRLLDGRGADIATNDLGVLDLKGITNAVSAVEILYQHDPLAFLRRLPFVAREEEFEALAKKAGEMHNGSGCVVLIAGEPGIGKTRLAEEVCAHAAAGAMVVRGACYEGEIATPYRPWIEVLRSLVEQLPPDQLGGVLGPGAPEIATILPDLTRRLHDVGQAPRLDPEAERARLFDSIVASVRNATQVRPVVIFLDDLHWADKPSLVLLELVAHGAAGQRLLIIGTYRDLEVDRIHPLARTLASLRRLEHHERIALHGLSEEGVRELLATIEPSAEAAPGRQALAQALHAESEGNPFFIREVLNHLIETGKLVHEGGRWQGGGATVAELGIPEGVREVIGRRLSRLSEGCNRMLQRSSAVTGGFTWDELAAICDEGEEALLDALDEAIAAQLIAERGRGRYDFTHALIRHTLYDELNTPRRALLHRQVAVALEALYANEIDDHLSELAAHYLASSGGDAEKAIEYSVRAGDRTAAQYAWEDAAEHYDRALQAIELTGVADAERRSNVLLKLGEARLRSGDAKEAIDAYRAAAALARETGDVRLLARAAIGFEAAGDTTFGEPGLRREALGLLDDALSTIGDTDALLRLSVQIARIRPAAALSGDSEDLFRSGGFGAWTGAKDPAVEAEARAAVAEAERLGDPSLHARALSTLILYIAGPANAKERLELATEQLRLAQQAHDIDQEVDAIVNRLHALYRIGDIATFERELAVLKQRADETRQGVWSAYTIGSRAGLASAQGRFGEAEPLMFQALELGGGGVANAVTTFGGQLYVLRWLQGRVGEVEGVFRDSIAQSPGVPVYRTALCRLLAELGRLDEARTEFEYLSAGAFADIPQDWLWAVTIAVISDTCWHLGDRDRAEQLYRLLLPFADFNASIAHSISIGSVCRSLGLLASVLERWEDAERHFEDAVAMNRRMEHWAWVAMTQLNYAQMLVRRASTSSAPTGDRDRAAVLLSEALAFARESGMAKVQSDAERLLASAEVSG